MSNDETAMQSGDQLGRVGLKGLLGYLVFIELASGFTQGYYTPLIPAVGEHLAVSDSNIIWFMTLQTLAAAVSVPLLSKLGDIYGHRRLLRIAVGTVLVGTVVVALMPSFPVVLLGRILTGPLAVWLPLQIAIVHSRASGDSARSAIGLMVSVLTGGAILGTVSSGAVASAMPSLHFTLLVPSVLIAFAFWAALFRIPATEGGSKERVDGLGFLGLAAGMVALLSGLKAAESYGFGSLTTVAVLAASAAILGIWVWWELKAKHPAVDVRLVVSSTLGPLYLTGFLFGMMMFGIQAPLTVFLSADPAVAGYGFSANTSLTSAVIASVMVMATIGAATFTRIAKMIGVKGLLILAVALAGTGSAFVLFFNSELWNMFVYAAVFGTGVGFLLGALPAVISELAPAGQTAVATGVYNSLLSLGGATAGAVFAVILGKATPPGSDYAALDGYLTIWGIGVGAFTLALVFLFFAKIPKDVAEEVIEGEAEPPLG